jgi:hypothetical protein
LACGLPATPGGWRWTKVGHCYNRFFRSIASTWKLAAMVMVDGRTMVVPIASS